VEGTRVAARGGNEQTRTAEAVRVEVDRTGGNIFSLLLLLLLIVSHCTASILDFTYRFPYKSRQYQDFPTVPRPALTADGCQGSALIGVCGRNGVIIKPQ